MLWTGALDVLAVGSAGLAAAAAAAAPALRWQALADWIGEGIWGATGEDVSDDVVSVGWRWGGCGLPVRSLLRQQRWSCPCGT